MLHKNQSWCFVLLCGLDGTTLLFKPFLKAMPAPVRAHSKLLIYRMNDEKKSIHRTLMRACRAAYLPSVWA
ncbi:MAG: hypothetical protein Q4C68_02265 [Moraxella sp.]|nr:hypothetical protein [Moraxella sp.]